MSYKQLTRMARIERARREGQNEMIGQMVGLIGSFVIGLVVGLTIHAFL